MKCDSVYVTFDSIGLETGAGKVCYHEVEALKRATNLKTVISKQDISKRIDQHYPFNPFLYDYFAADLLSGPVDIAHLSCSPGMAILNKLRPKRCLVNVVAHDLKISIEEHERIMGAPYPFVHNTDPYLHRALLKHAEKADVVLTPSEGSARWIRENIKVKRIEVIPHGCDLPGKVEPIPENFKAGYLGVWGPDKGLVYLLMAWDDLNYKDAEFVFAGDCGGSLKAIIPSLTENNPTYRILGRVADISTFFNSISVYVQPSVTEGWGITVGEAMAHARPVIVSEGAGSSDMVEEGKEGFVVPIRDPKAIAEKINYFKKHPKEMRKMGENARVKAEKYSWMKVEEIYGELYRELGSEWSSS